MPSCTECNDTGIIETGTNDLPCDCPAGNAAQFNVAGIAGPVSGAFLKRTSRDIPAPAIASRKMTEARWPKLNRGTLVAALQPLDASGANVPAGMLGVVFEVAEHHEPNTGPMVRWINGSACNVYEGWVTAVI